MFDFFVFRELSFQEFQGDSRLFLQSVGCQHIGVGDLIGCAFEAFDFDDALFSQFGEDVVGFAQADAHPAGNGPLREVGLGGQEFKEFVVDFLFGQVVHRVNVYARLGEVVKGLIKKELQLMAYGSWVNSKYEMRISKYETNLKSE